MSPAPRLHRSATLGEQPEPLTFERFIAANRHLQPHEREELFWTLPPEVRAECWRALQAQLDRIRSES